MNAPLTAGLTMIGFGIVLVAFLLFGQVKVELPAVKAIFGASQRVRERDPRLHSWIVNLVSYLAAFLVVVGAVFMFVALLAGAEDEGGEVTPPPTTSPTATATPTTTPTTPTTPTATATPTTTPTPPSTDIAGTWAENGGTFEFELTGTTSEGTMYKYTELDILGDFFGQGTATVNGTTVHLEGTDQFLGAYEADLEIDDGNNLMEGDKVYKRRGQFPLILHRE